MNLDVLFGKTREHLTCLEGTEHLLHRDMLQDFLRLREDARKAGFELSIASAFRGYERQEIIWNAKATGQRQLLDEKAVPLVFELMSPIEIAFAILRWSAVPGGSRHHWGTDVDVFDRRTQGQEDVKLVPSEVTAGGPAAPLHDWLDERIKASKAYGFFRPYETDRGGVAPERWHLSYAPLSQSFLEAYTFAAFWKNISDSELVLKNVLLQSAEEIYQRFMLNVDHP